MLEKSSLIDSQVPSVLETNLKRINNFERNKQKMYGDFLTHSLRYPDVSGCINTHQAGRIHMT